MSNPLQDAPGPCPVCQKELVYHGEMEGRIPKWRLIHKHDGSAICPTPDGVRAEIRAALAERCLYRWRAGHRNNLVPDGLELQEGDCFFALRPMSVLHQEMVFPAEWVEECLTPEVLAREATHLANSYFANAQSRKQASENADALDQIDQRLRRLKDWVGAQISDGDADWETANTAFCDAEQSISRTRLALDRGPR